MKTAEVKFRFSRVEEVQELFLDSQETRQVSQITNTNCDSLCRIGSFNNRLPRFYSSLLGQILDGEYSDALLEHVRPGRSQRRRR